MGDVRRLVAYWNFETSRYSSPNITIYPTILEEQPHMTRDSAELGIPFTLPHTSLRILWIIVEFGVPCRLKGEASDERGEWGE